jgi:hypothetical protein
MSLIPVKGHKWLYRDTNTNAIINMDTKNSNHAAIKQKMIDRDNDIQSLKNDMAEIKDILKQLLEN